MNWYELGNGPLRALKILLDSPLDFDPVDYIERTFGSNVNAVTTNTLRLAMFYNEARKKLFPKVSGAHIALSSSTKLDASNYNSISPPLIHGLSNSQIFDRKISEALAIKTCDSVNLQIDRLLESFKVRNCTGNSLGGEVKELISFYLLSEALFFVLVGIAIVEFNEESIIVKPANNKIVNQLHRKWFANYWEQLSSMASIAYFDMFPKGFDKNENFKQVICLLGQGFRDKIFSIPATELPGRLNRLESIKWVSKICNLAALCMWCQLKNEMSFAPYELVEKIGVSRSDIDELMGLIDKRSQPDRIFSLCAKGVKLENPSIPNQLRIIINDIANTISEGKLNQVLGDFFEKKYISEFFSRDDLSDKYIVHSGILAHEIEGNDLKPDVDFILEDLRRKKFYFVQVKYLRTGGKAFISGDLDYIVSGKLTKGINQLAYAKKAVESGRLKDLLNKRGLKECNQNNSIFLIIHNVSNFDFCIWPSGIVSYEWNSIRNLFKDGNTSFGHSKSFFNTWKHSAPLPIEHPDEVIKFLMNNGPASRLGGAHLLFNTDNVFVKTTIGDKNLFCYGLGL